MENGATWSKFSDSSSLTINKSFLVKLKLGKITPHFQGFFNPKNVRKRFLEILQPCTLLFAKPKLYILNKYFYLKYNFFFLLKIINTKRPHRMKQIIHFMFPGPATESWEIKSMQGRAFKKEKHYSLSCKREKLNGGGHHCTDFYGRPSGYPCPSQPHVMHQSQLCWDAAAFLHPAQTRTLAGMALPLSSFSSRSAGSRRNTGIQELLEVIKILLQITSVVRSCLGYG